MEPGDTPPGAGWAAGVVAPVDARFAAAGTAGAAGRGLRWHAAIERETTRKVVVNTSRRVTVFCTTEQAFSSTPAVAREQFSG